MTLTIGAGHGKDTGSLNWGARRGKGTDSLNKAEFYIFYIYEANKMLYPPPPAMNSPHISQVRDNKTLLLHNWNSVPSPCSDNDVYHAVCPREAPRQL